MAAPTLALPPGQKVSLDLKYIRCTRANCRVCTPDPDNKGLHGHGPYWYAFWKEGGRTRSRYIGKELPPALAAMQAEKTQTATGAGRADDTAYTPALFADAPSGQPRLAVQTLGGWALTVETPPTSRELPLPTQKSRALLTYLLLRQGTPQSRSVLAGLFWPETPEELARNSVSKALSHIRRALTDAAVGLAISADRERVALAPTSDTVVMDATLFATAVAGLGRDDDGALRLEDRAQVARVEEALRLYRGGFLPGVYDEWAETERDHLAALYTAALRGLVRFYVTARLWERAAAWGEALLQHDPLDESTQRQLIYLHYARGNTAAALRQYEECVAILARELQLAPETETTELYEAIKRRGLVVPGGAAPSLLDSLTAQTPAATTLAERFETVLPLVGRDRPLAALLAAWNVVQTGGSRMVFIAGEAGVGKTRLLQEAQKRAPAHAIVVTARCYPGESDLPYQPVLELVRALLPTTAARLPTGIRRTLAEMLPELAVPTPTRGEQSAGSDSTRFFEAVGYVVNLAMAAGPVVLGVEDVHWASSSTLHLLTYLLHRHATRPLLVVGSYRPEELPDAPTLAGWLNEQAREARVQTIPLARLTEADVATVAAQLDLAAPTPDAGAWLYRETEGNPLFIVETLRSLDEQASAGEDRGAETAPVVSRNPIQRIVAERMGRLSEPTQHTLEAAAVLGRHFTMALVRAVAHRAEEDVLIDLDRVSERNFVYEESAAPGEVAAYNFVHDKVRETIYTGLSAARRQVLHRRAAETLEQMYTGQGGQPSDGEPVARPTHVNPGDVAQHYLAAADPEKAWPYVIAAGDQASRLLARREAIDWYDQAISVVTGRSVADIRAPQTAEPHLRNNLLAGLDDGHSLRLLEVAARRGTAWNDLLEPEKATGDFRLMWDAARRIGRRDLEVDALNLLAYALMWRTPEEARACSEEALWLSEELGDLYRTADSLWTLGYNPLLSADPVMQPVAVSYMERALALARQVGSVGRAISALTTLGYVFYYTHGAFDTALALYEQTLAGPDYTDETHQGGIRSWLLADAGLIYLTLWDIPAAESRLTESLRIANRDRGYWPVARQQIKGYALAGLALSHAMAGDAATAASYIAQASELSEYLHHHHYMVLAEALLWLGRWDEAAQVARTHLAVPAAGVIYNAAAHKIAGIARWRTGDADGAEEELSAALQAMDRIGLTIYQWQVEAALARLTEARGRPGAALVRYRRALATLERLAGGIGDPERRDAFLRHAPVADLRERIARLTATPAPLLAPHPTASLHLVGYAGL